MITKFLQPYYVDFDSVRVVLQNNELVLQFLMGGQWQTQLKQYVVPGQEAVITVRDITGLIKLTPAK